MIPEYRTVIFGRILLGSFITEVMAFGALLSVIHAVEFQRRGMEQTAQAARLETLLAEAEILAGLGDEAHRWLETLDASHAVRKKAPFRAHRPQRGDDVVCRSVWSQPRRPRISGVRVADV